MKWFRKENSINSRSIILSSLNQFCWLNFMFNYSKQCLTLPVHHLVMSAPSALIGEPRPASTNNVLSSKMKLKDSPASKSIGECFGSGSIADEPSSSLVVMPKFGPEPKFEPNFWELDRKFGPKFSAFAEPDTKSSPAFTWMSIFLNAFERGSNRTYGPPGRGPFLRWIFFLRTVIGNFPMTQCKIACQCSMWWLKRWKSESCIAASSTASKFLALQYFWTLWAPGSNDVRPVSWARFVFRSPESMYYSVFFFVLFHVWKICHWQWSKELAGRTELGQSEINAVMEMVGDSQWH